MIFTRETVPRIYAITAELPGITHLQLAEELLKCGVRWIQLRQKSGSDRDRHSEAGRLRALIPAGRMLFINDRADIALSVGAHGVHLGDRDMAPSDVDRLSQGRTLLVGRSTHSVREAISFATDPAVDYIALGPIFISRTKNVSAPLGLAALSAVRSSTRKIIVAIGGIDQSNIRSVIEAGADSVALIAALYEGGDIRSNLDTIQKALD